MRSASVQLVEVTRTLPFTRWQLVTRLYLPSVLPSTATGVHLALIYAWVASIGGRLIIVGRRRFQMDLGILIPGLVGFLINSVASATERRLLRRQ